MEGGMTLLERQIHRRFGKLGAKASRQLKQLDESRMGELAEAIFDFQNKKEIEKWLKTASAAVLAR